MVATNYEIVKSLFPTTPADGYEALINRIGLTMIKLQFRPLVPPQLIMIKSTPFNPSSTGFK